MLKIKTLASSAIAVLMAGAAYAGGFAAPVETPVITVVEPAAPGFSLPVWVIPAIVLVALVALAASKKDEDDGEGDNGGGDGGIDQGGSEGAP